MKVPSLSQEERNILIIRDQEMGAKRSVQANVFKQTSIFLDTLSQFTTPSPKPFVFSINKNVLSLCLKGMKASCSGHFFRSSLS